MADKNKCRIKITENGPYLITGGLPLSEQIIDCDENGDSRRWKEGKRFDIKDSYALCRCGHSKNMPYCDGAHLNVDFVGRETASRDKFDKQAEAVEGEGVILLDAKNLCSVARFCDYKDGAWQLALDSKDPNSKKLCIEESKLCPSGRLVAIDKKTGRASEPECDLSIGLIQDPEKKVSGPIWLRGGIPVESSDGFEYEIRNRQTLCRCGESSNKPYCDGSHISCGFQDNISEKEA